jgi:hypothetical protein
MVGKSEPGGVLPPSTVLQNRYRIIRLYDRGGSATVYLAERLGVEERVPLAVKELNPDAFSLAEFKNEVNVLYSLNHPNLPKVYDFFEEGGRHYLVMDFVQGRTLKDIVLQSGPLSEDQALDHALQVCDIMSYLHGRAERKIIHRDLKPSNLMLTPSGQVKLLDFGIARVPDSRLPGNLLHAYTEDYASPEQKANLPTDERSDIYSFGVTLRFLLTGEADPGEGRPVKVSREVRRILRRCLRPDPEERYQSFDELARDIRAYRQAKRTRLTRALQVAAAGVGLIALLLVGKWVLVPSLHPVAGPDRVEVGTSAVLEVALPAAWSGSLQSIVWEIIDTQSPGTPLETRRGRYLSFGSSCLGVFQVQAYLEEDGRRRPLSEVKRIEVYPALAAPPEALVGLPVSLRSPGAVPTSGREYTWIWEVRGPVGGGGAGDAPLVLREVTTEPRFEHTFLEEGEYVVQVSARVEAAGGVEVTLLGERKTVGVASEIAVDPERVVNRNGGFEEEYDRGPVHWVLVYPERVVYDKTQGRSDTRSLRFEPWSGVHPSYAVQLVPLEPGRSYQITAWVKGENVAEGARIVLEARFRSAVDETYVLREESLSLDWTGTFPWRQVLLWFTVPPDKTPNLEVYLKFSGEGRVWFDDCYVVTVD